MFGFNFEEMLLGIPGLIIAMTFHEYAHARVAVSLGDFTPRLMGRLTLDPRAHIDPIGLIMLFLVRFGWAKPVMVNPSNFRQPKRDDILVSVAGPAMNLLLGFIAFYAILFIRSHNLDVLRLQCQFCHIQHAPDSSARWLAYPAQSSATRPCLSLPIY